MVKNLPANAGDVIDAGSIPGSGKIPWRRACNPLQHSCLENPMDRGAWWATVQWIAESDSTEISYSIEIDKHFHFPQLEFIVASITFLEHVSFEPR